MAYWHRVPKTFDGEGWGPEASGRAASLVGEQYIVANDIALVGYTAISEDEARLVLGNAFEVMNRNATPEPKTFTVEVSTAELGRISTGDFTLVTADAGFKADDWLRLVEVDALGEPTGAGLYPLVIDAVLTTDSPDPLAPGEVYLIFGMAIE